MSRLLQQLNLLPHIGLQIFNCNLILEAASYLFIHEIFVCFYEDFNMILRNQPTQISLVFNILADLILLLLVYAQSYSSMSDRLNFKQHEHLLKLSFNCFLVCSILEVTCNINIDNFGIYLKVFVLLAISVLLCLTNKRFIDMASAHLISGKYLKSYKSLSVLVHLLHFTIYLMHLSVKLLPFAVWTFPNFVILLFLLI